MNGISIIICCYNSSTRLYETIKHIAFQKGINFPYEIILVDNNSSDKTAEVAENLLSKFEITHYKIVLESKPGLTYARKCGVMNAKHEILLFCDDDNWLEENYLFNVIKGFQKYPNAGILGAWSVPAFETNQVIPNWFNSIKTSLAIIECPKKDLERYRVVGAGLAIRKNIATIIFSSSFIALDRTRNLLISGGDNEICNKTIKKGYEIYLLKSLKYTHYIPGNRLRWPYITRLYTGFGYGDMQTSFQSYNKNILRLYIGFTLLNLKKILKRPKTFIFFLFEKEGEVSSLDFFRIKGSYTYLHSQFKNIIQ